MDRPGLAVDKADTVTGPGVNVFPLLAAAPQDNQEEEEGVEAGRQGLWGERIQGG